MGCQEELTDWRVYLVYELPDRHIITVGIERFRCVEMSFQPSVTGNKSQRTPIRYGLEDFSCLPLFSIRCGPRKASTMNPAPSSSTVVFAHFRATVVFEIDPVSWIHCDLADFSCHSHTMCYQKGDPAAARPRARFDTFKWLHSYVGRVEDRPRRHWSNSAKQGGRL